MVIKSSNPLAILVLAVLLFTFQCKSSETQDGKAPESGSEMDPSDPDEKKSRDMASRGKGCIKGDCVNGFGVYVYENGDIYTGNFKNDKRDGEGSFEYANGETFRGIYKEDNRIGKGIYTFSNGDKFVGEFDKGEITGPGVYTFQDGKSLTGEFTKNGSTGKGTLLDSSGKTQNCQVENRKLRCD